ncbi:uncharacterized protein CXorf58 homolog [Suncus etruscus]|uniref:uncharacterized protein CXorf58 homolog n=1 Tax=Suncus etruscus TaxID=109475 RepID=UPI00210FE2CD|nr:uncharacterized protein CXorf58 homolog [Suncus etruscus]
MSVDGVGAAETSVGGVGAAAETSVDGVGAAAEERAAPRGPGADIRSSYDDGLPCAPVVGRRPIRADAEGGALGREEGGARPCRWRLASPSLEALIWRAILHSQGLGIVGTTPATRGRLSTYQPLRKADSGRSRLKPDIPQRKISEYVAVKKMNIHTKKKPPSTVRKSAVPLLKEEQKLELPMDSIPELRSNKEEKVKIIQKAWYSYIDKLVFRLLKHAIYALDKYVTQEILKRASPSEAELVKDPTMKHTIKFRFNGEIFPPYIVFKIFLHTLGRGYKYLCGRNILNSSIEVIVDTYNFMGRSKFYRQMKEDEHLHRKFEISDEIDVITSKDYLQYSNLLDKIPASYGGKNNHWRRLKLEDIPKTMMIYDIIDLIQSGIVSKRLQKELKFLLLKPWSEEMRQHQLHIITEVRTTEPLTLLQKPAKQAKNSRSKKAQKKAENMSMAYKTNILEKLENVRRLRQVIFPPSSDLVELFEPSTDPNYDFLNEKQNLFDWCEKLITSNALKPTN